MVAKVGRTPDPAAIRRHVALLLAEFKLPQRILVVPEIPKGPTGKPQRIGLAEKLGLAGPAPDSNAAPREQPESETERRLAKIWTQSLENKSVGRADSFFASGGDSLSATMLLALVEQQFKVALPIRALFEAGTLAEMAALIDRLPPIEIPTARRFTSLVPFQTEAQRRRSSWCTATAAARWAWA